MPTKTTKNIVASFIAFCVSISFFGCENSRWITISEKRIHSISGVSSFKDKWIVVHDNKSNGQPRISLLSETYQLRELIWPNSLLPYDLEAIYSIPNNKNQYVVMESTGVCYRIVLDETTEQIKIEGKFKLPGLNKSMNLEGVALFESDENIKIFYGDRGSNTRPSTLFHADYNVQEDDVKVVGSYSLTLLEQMPEKRNIADLVFDESGNLWSSATSDPGNDGPFETKIFRIGKISKQGYFTLEKPLKSKKIFKNEKVEAMTVFEDGILLLTDNENFGSRKYFIKLKSLL